jgi:hypothetical protein
MKQSSHDRAVRSTGQQSGGGCPVSWCLVVLLVTLPFSAETSKPAEYDVKAAYLFNFAKFVKWPGTAVSWHDFPICVLGANPFGPALNATVAGERADGKPVTIRHLASANDGLSCRILYISGSEERRLGSIFATLGQAPVLTVSDIDGFADRNGMIQFVMDHDRVRFQVNLSAAERVGLALSSDLLKVATSVKREGHSGE